MEAIFVGHRNLRRWFQNIVGYVKEYLAKRHTESLTNGENGKLLSNNRWKTRNRLGESQQLNEIRRIALKRINILFCLAKEKIREEPELAQRYVKIARKIAMRTKIRLPKEYRQMICRHCKSFIYPGVNCRVRVQQRRESHMVITCLICSRITRMPLRTKNSEKEKKKL